MAILNTVLMCAGVGLGPMLSNVVRQGLLSMDGETGYPGRVCGLSVLVVALLSVLWLAAFVLFVPGSNEGVPVPLGAVRSPDSQSDLGAFLAVETDEEAARKEAAQKKLFVTYLVVQTERAWLVAGLEVVTVMVMEQEVIPI